MKKIFNNENGDTNIVSLIILLIVIIVAIIIFKPYIMQGLNLIQGLIGE